MPSANDALLVARPSLRPLPDLLLDADFNLKLCDFGFAKAGTAPFVASCMNDVGTRAYKAPELISAGRKRGRVPYDGCAADVWSSAVVLFAMLANAWPFEEARHEDWYFRTLASGKPGLFWKAHRRFAAFPPGAVDLITRCFAVDPAERPSAAEALQHPWVLAGAAAAEGGCGSGGGGGGVTTAHLLADMTERAAHSQLQRTDPFAVSGESLKGSESSEGSKGSGEGGGA